MSSSAPTIDDTVINGVKCIPRSENNEGLLSLGLMSLVTGVCGLLSLRDRGRDGLGEMSLRQSRVCMDRN